MTMTTPAAASQGGQRRPFTHPLKAVMDDGRHPWVWAELSAAEAEILCGLLDAFVHYYNSESVSDPSELIPGCWRGHPRLMHELPVLYWQWFTCHHHPKAEVHMSGEYYGKTLPGFQRRLDTLIGMAATMCRKRSAQHRRDRQRGRSRPDDRRSDPHPAQRGQTVRRPRREHLPHVTPGFRNNGTGRDHSHRRRLRARPGRIGPARPERPGATRLGPRQRRQRGLIAADCDQRS